MSTCNSSIDWLATGSMLQGIGTIIGAAAVLIAAFIGATTFSTWRRQRITERHIDRAETLLGAAYEARSALSAVRSPMMFANEIQAAEAIISADPRFAGLAAEKQKRMTTCQAYYERLKRTLPQRNKLYELEPIARAVFGAELADAVDKLAHQFWIIQIDVEAYVDDTGGDVDFAKELRATMYENRTNDQSKVGKNTAEAIQKIESICLPILRMEPLSIPSQKKASRAA